MNQLPTDDRLVKHDLETRHPIAGRAAQRVIGDRRAGRRRHRMVGRNVHLELAQRSLADVQLDVGHDPPVGLRKLIDRHFIDAQLGHDPIGRDDITPRLGRKPVDQDLPQRFVGRAGKLPGRHLHQPLGIFHLHLHRTLVRHPQPAAVPQRADR